MVAGTQLPPVVQESKGPESCHSHADSEPDQQSQRLPQSCRPSPLPVITAGCGARLGWLLSHSFSLHP